MVPEQEIQNQEDHEKRRASTRAQPQLQRPHGLQLPAVPGRLGRAGPVQGAQPAATEHQHHGLEFFGKLGLLVPLSRQHRCLPFADPQLDTALIGSWSRDVILKTKTKTMFISELFLVCFPSMGLAYKFHRNMQLYLTVIEEPCKMCKCVHVIYCILEDY